MLPKMNSWLREPSRLISAWAVGRASRSAASPSRQVRRAGAEKITSGCLYSSVARQTVGADDDVGRRSRRDGGLDHDFLAVAGVRRGGSGRSARRGGLRRRGIEPGLGFLFDGLESDGLLGVARDADALIRGLQLLGRNLADGHGGRQAG